MQFLEHELDTEPRPISEENGFTTLDVHDEVTKNVPISIKWWWKQGLQVGKEYDLMLPWAHVGWWEKGSVDGSDLFGGALDCAPNTEGLTGGVLEDMADRRVAIDDVRRDGGFKIPKSNAVKVRVVE